MFTSTIVACAVDVEDHIDLFYLQALNLYLRMFMNHPFFVKNTTPTKKQEWDYISSYTHESND